jgi:manganese efflux pump family protein
VPGLVGRTAAGAFIGVFLIAAIMLADPRPARASSPPGHGTMRGCTAAAIRAVRRGVTMHSRPAACRGLSRVQLERAAITAIVDLAGPGDKARLRHRAAIAGRRLAYLLGYPRRGAPARGPRRPASALQSVARVIPVGPAALVAWLLTATTGGYLLAGWLRHGGIRRARTSEAGLPPGVIFSHFGLAITGLIGWISYLITNVPAVAWLSAVILLPVVGLGMSTLLLAVPEGGPVSSRARMPVLVISAHGICATATLLLVLLAAVTAH